VTATCKVCTVERCNHKFESYSGKNTLSFHSVFTLPCASISVAGPNSRSKYNAGYLNNSFETKNRNLVCSTALSVLLDVWVNGWMDEFWMENIVVPVLIRRSVCRMVFFVPLVSPCLIKEPTVYWPTKLTPWRGVLEKLTCPHLVKKFTAFYENRMCITAITTDSHLSLSWAR
jgi:hypothetical protein